MKKTVLDESAGIYRKRIDGLTKEGWKTMSSEEKLRYFKDYYLIKLIIGIASLAVVVYLVWTFVQPKQDQVLYIGIVDNILNEEEIDTLRSELEDLLGVDGKKEGVMVDDSFTMNENSLLKLRVFQATGQVDVIVSDREAFETLSERGFFVNAQEFVSQYIPQMKDLLENGDESHYRIARGLGDMGMTGSEADAEEESANPFDYLEQEVVLGGGPAEPFGIEVPEDSSLSDMMIYMKEPVIGFLIGSSHPENAAVFLEWLWNK